MRVRDQRVYASPVLSPVTLAAVHVIDGGVAPDRHVREARRGFEAFVQACGALTASRQARSREPCDEVLDAIARTTWVDAVKGAARRLRASVGVVPTVAMLERGGSYAPAALQDRAFSLVSAQVDADEVALQVWAHLVVAGHVVPPPALSPAVRAVMASVSVAARCAAH